MKKDMNIENICVSTIIHSLEKNRLLESFVSFYVCTSCSSFTEYVKTYVRLSRVYCIKMAKDTALIMETSTSSTTNGPEGVIGFLPNFLPNSATLEKSVSENEALLVSTTSETDYDNKTELRHSEKENIMHLLTKMQKTALWMSQAERKEYYDSEHKLIELLREAQSTLTQSEKEGFLKEIRQINQMKKNKDLERQKEERNDCEQYVDTEYAVDFWAVVLKIPELAMVLIAFQKNITSDCSDYEIVFNVICLSAAICTACLLVYYCTCRKPSMLMLVCEFLYCSSCFTVFIVFSIYYICGDVLFFECGAAIAYGSEILTKIHAMCRKQKSLDNTQHRTLRFKKYRKWQYWFPKDRSNTEDRTRRSRSNSSGSESAISLNLLNSFVNENSKNSDRSKSSANFIDDD